MSNKQVNNDAPRAQKKRPTIKKKPAKQFHSRKQVKSNRKRDILRGDVRINTDNYDEITLPNQMNAINFLATMDENVLYGVCEGYVSEALARGFLARSQGPEDPAFAARFMYDILYSYAAAAPIVCPKMPQWLRDLGAAISPTIVPFQLGQGSYKFSSSAFSGPLGARPIGDASYGYYWNPVGVNTGVVTNMFPVSSGLTNTAYNTELGCVAFQTLVQFMAENEDDDRSKLVDYSSPSKYEKDVSAYCEVAAQLGLGEGYVGGVASLSQLEVPIFHPILSKFVAPGASDENITRFYNFAIQTGGDSLFLGAALSSYLTRNEWKARRAPRFHPIWFDEFADVAAHWITGVIQTNYNEAITPVGPGPFPTTCPLTFQDFCLLLRATLMCNFADTQPMVQSLYPREPQSSTDPEFVPFVAGANTCALADPGMQLPTPLIENMRCLTGRKFQVGKNEHDVLMYIPVLGNYANRNLEGSLYKIEIVQEPNFIPVFATETGVVRRTMTQKGQVEVKIAEVPIDLVDGTTSGSGGAYVFINDPARLAALASIWNNWLQNTGYSTNSVALSTLGKEKGLKVLASIAMTRYLGLPEAGVKEFVDVRREKYTAPQPIFEEAISAAVSSQGPILAAPYQQVQERWILPTIKMGQTKLSDSTWGQRWQAYEGEPFLAPDSSGTTAIPLSDQHAVYAAKMYRGKLAQSSDWDTFFKHAEKEGRGGILSGLGGVLDSIFGI